MMKKETWKKKVKRRRQKDKNIEDIKEKVREEKGRTKEGTEGKEKIEGKVTNREERGNRKE